LYYASNLGQNTIAYENTAQVGSALQETYDKILDAITGPGQAVSANVTIASFFLYLR